MGVFYCQPVGICLSWKIPNAFPALPCVQGFLPTGGYCWRFGAVILLHSKTKTNRVMATNLKTAAGIALCTMLFCVMPTGAGAQDYSAADSVQNHVKGNRLSIGGYGEAAYTRNFYSDNVFRYNNPQKYKNDPSHGRFDIPHAVIYLGYDFGKGWSMGSEIEFEHTGTGTSQEKEFTEGGEWEQEVEKGGEVELEQFWLQKTFFPELNVRAGHIVVPVGLTNARHEPLNYFTVYRPEGEATILPCTWHDTGISIWGRSGDFRYEVQMVAGLDAFLFNRENWIQKGSGSPYEFKVANKYGFAARIDNYTIPGLRLGFSGYLGRAMHNSFPHELEGKDENNNTKTYDKIKGNVALGSFDFTFNKNNVVARGNVDYGYVGNAAVISDIKRNNAANSAPYQKTPVGKNAISVGLEAGYDVFSQIESLRGKEQKLYVFGHYEYYNSYMPSKQQPPYEYTKKIRVACGLNYYPIPQIAVKAEYSKRFLRSQYNDEPSVSLGVAYEGFFL